MAGLVRLSSVALYAAYGSNMDPAQMAKRCPHSPQRGSGWLEGWRLTFGGEDISWEGARATVVEDAGQRVFVVLYDVPETDERALDRWDGATLDYYRKLRVRVETLDGDALAWLYVLNAYEGGLPSARNLGLGRPAVGAQPRPAGRRGGEGRGTGRLRRRDPGPALRLHRLTVPGPGTQPPWDAAADAVTVVFMAPMPGLNVDLKSSPAGLRRARPR